MRDRVAGDVSVELPEIVADPALLERVLVNLMSNAVRHSPPEHHERVFLPFQRLGDRDNGSARSSNATRATPGT